MTPTTSRDADQVLAVVEARQLAASGAARMIREAAGLSLADVAAACGADPSSVFRWEEGSRRPSGDRAIAYRDFLQQLQEVHSRHRRGVAA